MAWPWRKRWVKDSDMMGICVNRRALEKRHGLCYVYSTREDDMFILVSQTGKRLWRSRLELDQGDRWREVTDAKR